MGSKENECDLVNELGNLKIEENRVNSWNITGCQIHLLPMEIIIEIISYLNNIEDIRNCMLLCKQIRILMYKTPTIMRKIRLVLDFATYGPVDLSIIKKRGKLIRNLKIIYYINLNFDKLFYILTKVSNLEELTYECRPGNEYPVEFVLPELKHLKRLISNATCHNCFLSDTVNITKLETLKFCFENKEDSEILTNFLCRQRKLKELIIVKIIGHRNFFLSRDISDEIQFKLTKFVCTFDDYDENFLKFLKSQAENLLELETRLYPDYNILNTIFTKCKKLKKFTSTINCQFSPDDPSNWTLKTLKHFIAKTTTSVNLSVICRRFPNLVSLVCSDMVPCEGIFHKLETLYMFSPLDCRKFNKLKLPNLKNLIIQSVEGRMWTHIKGNFPKIENLTITGDCSDFLAVLKSLDYFKELKTFKQTYEGRIASEFMYFKIYIDFIDYTIYQRCDYDFTTTKYINTKYYNFENGSRSRMSRDELYWI